MSVAVETVLATCCLFLCMKHKVFWIRLALINLSIVALLGLTLRTKIIFSIPFLDYRNVLSTHSHFAFAGWAGLALLTLLIYNLLPQPLLAKRIYQWILVLVEVSSLGMAVSFPFEGYGLFSVFFSSLYIFATYVFAFVFIKDVLAAGKDRTITLLSITAVISLVISSIGPFSLSYIMISKSSDSYLYRDSIYTFLHFQYNGFFTLSVLALVTQFIATRTGVITKEVKKFAQLMVASIVPSLFLSLLWHNNKLFYVLAICGCVLLIMSIYYFLAFIRTNNPSVLLQSQLAKRLFQLAFLSFAIKTILHLGTILPPLANAVYGDRPVIIGFLHLVFLGFITFYILSYLAEQGFFKRGERNVHFPVLLFSAGIIVNELLLGLQGLGVLFKTNSYLFNWLLWFDSILLFLGAVSIALSQLFIRQAH